MSTTRDKMDLLFQLLISGLFRYFHPHFKKSKNRMRHLHIRVSSFESSITLSSSKRNSEIPCHFRSHSLNNHQRKMSSSSSSSQQSGSSSPSMVEDRSKTEAMQAEALTVTPLRTMATDPERVKKLRTRNARRAQASPSGKTSIPSSSSPGTRSVHVAIARIVSDILNGNKSVPGISVPLNHKSASPSLAVDPDVNENVKTSGDDVDSPVKVDVNPSASVPEGCQDDNVMESPADNVNEIPDEILEKSPDHCTPDNSPAVSADNISDRILEDTPEKNTNQNTGSHIINLDEEFSDNDLIAKVNPSIARRVMNRKGKQSAITSSVHEKNADVSCKTPGDERKAVEKSGKSNKVGNSKGKGKVKNVGDTPKAKSTSIVRKR